MGKSKSPTLKELINELRVVLAEALMTPIIYLAPKDTEGGQRLIRWVGVYTKDSLARLRRSKSVSASPEGEQG